MTAMLALAALFVAIPWLARFQDIALQAAHASRFAAFSLAREPGLRPVAQIRRHFFSGPSHQWSDLRGRPILADAVQAQLEVPSATAPASAAQPGGDDPESSALRRGLRLDDWGIVQARVLVPFSDPADSTASGHETGQLAGGRAYPSLSRHTAILVDAGHASSDALVQRRVAESGPGWDDMASTSYSLGRRISGGAAGVDSGWGRATPRLDWLGPWAGALPDYHLEPREEAP
jgi:hypothetical protein